MIIQSVWQKSFDFFSKPVVVEPSEVELTSDAGLLPIRQFDEAIGLTEQFAAALTDRRQAASVDHTLLEMVRMRVYGILADYPDQNDHDVLRSDPAFKLVAGRGVDDDDLASQPTLSRFENAIDVKSLRRLQDVFIDQFIASYEKPPTQITGTGSSCQTHAICCARLAPSRLRSRAASAIDSLSALSEPSAIAPIDDTSSPEQKLSPAPDNTTARIDASPAMFCAASSSPSKSGWLSAFFFSGRLS